MRVACGLDEVEHSELTRERVIRLLRRAPEVRPAELSLPGRFALDRGDDELGHRERSALPRHAAAPFGVRITVIVRPSKLSLP